MILGHRSYTLTCTSGQVKVQIYSNRHVKKICNQADSQNILLIRMIVPLGRPAKRLSHLRQRENKIATEDAILSIVMFFVKAGGDCRRGRKRGGGQKSSFVRYLMICAPCFAVFGRLRDLLGAWTCWRRLQKGSRRALELRGPASCITTKTIHDDRHRGR